MSAAESTPQVVPGFVTPAKLLLINTVTVSVSPPSLSLGQLLLPRPSPHLHLAAAVKPCCPCNS